MKTKAYWIHAISPIHIGMGRGVGFIDLPIVREKLTGWPFIPGSAIKGVISDFFSADLTKRKSDSLLRTAFGIADDASDNQQQANSGSLVFTDSRLVCLPVRSFLGTFAWVTCPMVLNRLMRDLQNAGQTLPSTLKPADIGLDDQNAHVPASGSFLKDQHNSIFFEELDFSAIECVVASEWASWIAKCVFVGTLQQEFIKRFAVVTNDTFNFLTETGTEVSTRIKIDIDTKTVQHGALWTEESLPVETIMMGMIWCDKVFGNSGITQQAMFNAYCTKELAIQIGGHATTGKGQARCIFV